MDGCLFVQSILIITVLTVCGCASRREVGLPRLHASDVRVRMDEPAAAGQPVLEDDIGGPWQVVSGEQDLFADAAELAAGDVLVPTEASAPRPAPVRRPRVRARAPSEPRLAVPRRRAAQPARPEGKRLARTPEQLAREHFLDYPTHVRAAKITLYCPAAYAAAVRLRGEEVHRLGAKDRRATGKARLVLRELTLEADRITWKVRAEGEPDLQLLARGDVEIVSEVRRNVVRETGLRSLLITNDRMVPLR